MGDVAESVGAPVSLGSFQLDRVVGFSVGGDLSLEDALAQAKLGQCSRKIAIGQVPLFNISGDLGRQGRESHVEPMELEAGMFSPGFLGTADTRRAIIDFDQQRFWSQAQLGHLLALAARWPGLQLEKPIVCFGSTARIDKTPYFPVLSKNGSVRRLGLVVVDYEWDGYWVMAVRPASTQYRSCS